MRRPRSLRRQAKQSTRYRALAAEIRRHEALVKLIHWREHAVAFAEAERRLEADVREVAERTRAQAEAARLQAIAAVALPALRDAEARTGAALHRLTLARDALDGEEKRAQARVGELQRRVDQLTRDLEREESLIADAAQVAARLEAEDQALAEQTDGVAAAGRRRRRCAPTPSSGSASPRPRSPRRRPRPPISTRAATRSGRRYRRKRAGWPDSRTNWRDSSGSAGRCPPSETTRPLFLKPKPRWKRWATISPKPRSRRSPRRRRIRGRATPRRPRAGR